MRNHVRHLPAFFLAAALCTATTVSAQIFLPLHIFSTATGSSAPLAQGPDGTLYGVSAYGGVSGSPGYGTVFKVEPDGTGFDIIYSFTNGSDGSDPVVGLIITNNTLYGTAENGGSGGNGTVFEVNTDGTGFTNLHSFTGTPYPFTNIDGAKPMGSLVLAGSTLYGTASAGGSANGTGTIFKVNIDGTGYTNLYSFSGTNGAFPYAGLVLSGGTLYGTTEGGTIFKIGTDGMNFATVHTFSATVSGTNSDGARPEASLALSGDTLYGTASGGGTRGDGTVFSLNIADSSFTNLYNFTNGVDGSTPIADLVVSDGTLYGTASSGGISPGWGTVFKLKTDGTGFTNLYDLAQGNGGTMPAAGLLLSSNILYGTTPDTGGYTQGTVFKLNTNGSGFTVLANGSDGAQARGGLVLSGDSFYGTTSAGGSTGAGVVFKVGTNGTGFGILHTFSPATNESKSGDNLYANGDGAIPLGTLASSGGVLYGTTQIGGTFGVGTVFRLNTDGTGFTNLYYFTNGADGAFPTAALVLSGSALYGTASASQPFSAEVGGKESTIFKINTDGTGFTNLYNFTALFDGTNSDGSTPESGLVLGVDTLYGTTLYGGPGGPGTLFRINTNGMGFTNIHSFDSGSFTNISDGVTPVGGLILSGSTLYGTTSSSITVAHSRSGGGPGTVFKVNTDGTDFVNLHTFTAFDGSGPKGALVLSGGILYGTASSGGNGLAGTVFQINTDGMGFSTLHTFLFQQGTPVGDLVAIGNTVYGTSEYGGLPGSGSVFAVTPTGTPSIEFTVTPSNGPPPLNVEFMAPATDDKGNPIVQYHWDFGDGATSTSTPVYHTYESKGIYTPTLVTTNNNGLEVVGTGPTVNVAFPSSFQNNGFETGTFTNWTSTGNFRQAISTNALYAHSGNYGAQLGDNSSLGYLSQTISTTPGTMYTISFWLDSASGKTPNEFVVAWDGNTVFDRTNLPAIGWTNIQLTFTATNGSTVVEFGYRYNATYFGFDDVSFASGQPGIADVSLSGPNLILTCGGGISGQTYLVLMSTNLLQPIPQWTPVATNAPGADGDFSITATNVVDPNVPQRFYILQVQ